MVSSVEVHLRELNAAWIRRFPIPDPNCLHPGSRIRIKQFMYFNPKKTKKMVSKLQKIWSRLFIPDPGSGCRLSTHPGSWKQGSKRHRIPDPDPQHCCLDSRYCHFAMFRISTLIEILEYFEILFEYPIFFHIGSGGQSDLLSARL